MLKYLWVLDTVYTLKPLSVSLYLLWTQFQIIGAQSCIETSKPGVKNLSQQLKKRNKIIYIYIYNKITK